RAKTVKIRRKWPEGKVQGSALQSNPALSRVRVSGAAIKKKPRSVALLDVWQTRRNARPIPGTRPKGPPSGRPKMLLAFLSNRGGSHPPSGVHKTKGPFFRRGLLFYMVPRGGIEPPTRGFSIP